jgi:hypothetical protein
MTSIEAALRKALQPFADKANKYEANHPERHPRRFTKPYPSDSTQITHRLGDFRNARTALEGDE